MPRDPSHVFLSGASGDFEQVRLDLDKALSRGGCRVIHQDGLPQVASGTVVKLAGMIAPCGLVVHMIGEGAGSVPKKEVREEYLAMVDGNGGFLADRPELRAALGDFSDVTYTQWEAYIAIHLGLPLLVYADGSHASPSHPQRAHLDRLRGMVRYPTKFENHPQLCLWVMADMMAHIRLNPATQDIARALQPDNLPGGYIGQVFVGRDGFLEMIRESLVGGGGATAITQRPVATGISGLGGIGKTHAAVEYAHRHRGDYSALLFASADTPEKLNSSLAGLCDVLGLGGLPTDEPSRLKAALDWLAGNSGWLMIVDNVDDQPAALALRELLGRLGKGHLLITSRLHDWSMQVRSLDLSVLTQEASVELLLELTEARRRAATDDDVRARELAGLLDGLPLAIHQAAGYINENALTLEDYIGRFNEEAGELLEWFSNLSISYAGPETQHKRPEDIAPRPVLVTWKTSFEKLSDEDRFWLLVFSHFSPEPIPEFLLKAGEGVAEVGRKMVRRAERAVANAERYCLVTRSRSEPFFKIHRLVQQIVRMSATEEVCFEALGVAIGLIFLAEPGNALDVRSWLKWDPLLSHAVSICNHCEDSNPPMGVSTLLSNLDCLYDAKGLHREAEKYSRQALKIDQAAHGDDHPKVATRLNNLAQLLKYMNRLSEAEPLIRQSLQIDRAAYGDDHPQVAIRFNNLAMLLMDTNRQDEAEILVREALRIDRATYGDDHPKVANRLNNLAQLLKAANRLGEAEPLMRESLRIFRATYGEDHPDVAVCLSNLAMLLQDTNRQDEAEILIREALRIDRATYGDDHPKVANRLNNLALLLKDANLLSEAEPLMRDAVRIMNSSLGEEHPNSVTATKNLEILLEEMEEAARGGAGSDGA